MRRVVGPRGTEYRRRVLGIDWNDTGRIAPWEGDWPGMSEQDTTVTVDDLKQMIVDLRFLFAYEALARIVEICGRDVVLAAVGEISPCSHDKGVITFQGIPTCMACGARIERALRQSGALVDTDQRNRYEFGKNETEEVL